MMTVSPTLRSHESSQARHSEEGTSQSAANVTMLEALVDRYQRLLAGKVGLRMDRQGLGMPAEERQRRLLRFLCITGPVHDELTLYALAFLAQRLGLLDNLYEFDLGMNVPVSTTLGSDLYCLLSRGHLADSGKPGTISITERGVQHAGHNPREVRPDAAQKARTLAGLEPGVILALPHVSSLADSAAGPEEIERILIERNMVYGECARAAVNMWFNGGILNRGRGA